MADQKISAMTVATTPLTGAELVPLVQGGANVRATVANIVAIGGTVTTVSVASSNGFTGSVATATSTPVITLSTSITGILKGVAGALSLAVANSDYLPATTGLATQLLASDGSGGTSNVTVGSGLTFSAGVLASSSGGGSVTSVSVTSANGFAGTVATATSTPAITLSTTITGLLKGNGTAIAAATAGTDYAAATTGTSAQLLANNGSGGFSNVTVGTGLTLATGTLSATGTAGVSTFSAGTTGFTPNTASSGVITLSGTLVVANGGTGVTTSSGANSVMLRDANQNVAVNSIYEGFTSVAASVSVITLTVASTPNYLITGSGGQTIQLPDATTLANGERYYFNNNQSTGAIVVRNNSGTTITTIQSGGFVEIMLISNSIAAGTWDVHNLAPSNVSWSTNTLTYAGAISSATWNGVAIGLAYGGTGAASAPASMAALMGYTTTVTSGVAYVLTSSSTYYQILTGSTAQTITLPTTSTLTLGWSFHIYNASTANLTVNSSGGNLVITILPNTGATITCTLITGTTAASWNAALTDFSSATGTGSVVLATSPTLVTPALGTPASGVASNMTVDGTDSVGFRNIPVIKPGANNYGLVLTDNGKAILHESSDAVARTYTIPANGTVAYPIGTALTFVNRSSVALSITITTDTMYLANTTSTTVPRSLAQNGIATAVKVESTVWIISGNGLT